MRSGHHRWFWHVQREMNNVTRRVIKLAILGTRRRGRPKKTWHQHIKDDMTGAGVIQDTAQPERSGEGGQGRSLGDREKFKRPSM